MDTANYLLRWEVYGIVLAVILCFAFGVLTVDHFKAARRWFVAAAILTWAKIVIWGATTDMKAMPRMLWTSLLCAIVGVGLVETLQWIRHLQKKSKTEEVVPVQSPNLRLSIFAMRVFSPTNTIGMTGFVVTAQVMNLGPIPTPANGWSMTIFTPDGKRYQAPPSNPPETLSMSDKRIESAVLKKEDFALESLTQKPVRNTDSPVKSMILFYFLADQNYLLNPRSRVELSAADYTGKRYTDNVLVGDSALPYPSPLVAGVVLKNASSLPFKPTQRTKVSLSLHVDSAEFPLPVKVFEYSAVAPIFGEDKAKEDEVLKSLWQKLDSVRPSESSLKSADGDGIAVSSSPISQDEYTDIVEGRSALYFLVKMIDQQNRDIYEFCGFMPRPEISLIVETAPRHRVPVPQ